MSRRHIRTSFLLAGVALATPLVPLSAAPSPTDGEPAFRALFKEMVEINSAQEGGSCTTVVDAVAARMKAAGFPAADLHRFVPDTDPKAGILVAVLPGRDPKLKPVMMLGHLDVVNARRADWTRDPYQLV
jgi:acetylornithine deacetylase/succinyl-diaminopimelate desuccinylase-like protein